MATRHLPRGGSTKEGVTGKRIESPYFCTPVYGNEFSIGVVIPVSYQSKVLRNIEIPKGKQHFKHLT